LYDADADANADARMGMMGVICTDKDKQDKAICSENK
jgi:hypothetical protein